MNAEIADAIEAAAGADHDALTRLVNPSAAPSDRRITHVTHIIRRFLQNVPDDMTAMEMLRTIDDL